MKNFKDILVALGNIKWTHVLILLAIVVILLVGAAGLSYIYAQKGAKDAVNAELALQEQIHDYEMNLKLLCFFAILSSGFCKKIQHTEKFPCAAMHF